MKANIFFPIKYVALKTGLPSHLIRMWEKLYKAVVPRRSETNRRMPTVADVKRVHLLKKAVEDRHSVSKVANLPTDILIKLVNSSLHDVGSDVAEKGFGLKRRSLNGKYFFEMALNSVVKLEADGLETALDQAAVHLTRVGLLDDVIRQLCERIGGLWNEGKLKMINELMATQIILMGHDTLHTTFQSFTENRDCHAKRAGP